ncbi:MAG: homocysteine biosynthesis protein [Candidatus Thorarchaeota archaeon]
MKQEKTIREINERIRDGSVRVVTGSEMTEIVAEIGADKAVHEVDVVTTGTFGAMCSSGIWMNFGHAEPPIRMTRVWLNDVEAYAGVSAVDAYIGATQLSESLGMEYGGGHVIEDLVRGRSVHLRAESYGTDCYPRKSLSVEIRADEMNQAIMSNPRVGAFGAVATNSSQKTIYSYMGKLLPDFGNATFSGAGEISPIRNDPQFRTIGVGTRIFLGGAEGYVTGSGTQHSPSTGQGTLRVEGDLREMSSDFIKGCIFTRYGVSLYVGLGVPIPVLNEEVAKSTGVSDQEIVTKVIDYSVPSRARPKLRKVSYSDLKSGSIEIDGREVRTAPISSFRVAKTVANELRQWIASGKFFLASPDRLLSSSETYRHMVQRELTAATSATRAKFQPEKDQFVTLNTDRCVECGLCISFCEQDVFAFDDELTFTFSPELCSECELCGDVCPQRAIYLKS